MGYVRNIRVFVRVYELGSMSAAARDQRISPAVASNRISDLETHLGVRLFHRTTRSLSPTEQGRAFYPAAQKILAAIAEAEATIADLSKHPKGSIFVAAPLGVGRRIIAPNVPRFKALYPDVEVRLRLSDRHVDIAREGLDLSFILGRPVDSDFRMRKLADCPAVLCASPAYIARRGNPADGPALVADRHDCLLLRYPGAHEFRWLLRGAEGARRFDVSGPFESDDGGVLIAWALGGHGIINVPVFAVAGHLATGALVKVAGKTPPVPVELACLYPHKRLQDPKVRLFMDFMSTAIRAALESNVEKTLNSPDKSNTRTD